MPRDDLDLNLLRVFDAVLETGSVSAAAGVLHLSVPATSRALDRLRRALRDPIMVRSGRGLTPTPFALRSRAQVRALLDAAAALRPDPDDDPADWRRTFAIRINDGLVPVVGARVVARVAAEAPDVTIRFVSQVSKDNAPLRDGTLDLDVGVLDPPPPDINGSPLFRDRLGAVVAADSEPGRAERLTIEDLVRYPHISASRRGLDRGPLDDELGRLGRSRRVAAVVSNYGAAALFALEPGIIGLAPRVLAEHLVQRGMPLRWHDLPVPTPPVEVTMHWHRRLDEDRPSQWLRDHVHAAVRSFGADFVPERSQQA